MPATSRYPWETDDVFKQRMMGQNPAAFGLGGQQVAPGLPSKVPAQQGMLGGMGAQSAPPPMAAQMPMAPAPMGMDAGPTPDPQYQALHQGPPAPPAPTGIPEDVLDSLLTTPQDQAELEGLMEQRIRANALRDTALPEGRNAGRTFVAANPLEFLGAGIKQYRGGKQSKELDTKVGDTRKKIGGKQGIYTKEAAKQGGLDILFRKKKDEDKD